MPALIHPIHPKLLAGKSKVRIINTHHDVDLDNELRKGKEGGDKELDEEEAVEGGSLGVPRTYEQSEGERLASVNLLHSDRVACLMMMRAGEHGKSSGWLGAGDDTLVTPVGTELMI